MNSYFRWILKVFLFWWIIFTVNRFVFLIFFSSKLSGISFSEIAATFIHGFPLDLSAISYLLIVPVVFLLIQQFVPFTFFKRLLWIYSMVLLLLISFTCVFDLAIYKDWGTKLTYRAIHYLKFASEGAAFTDIRDDAILLFILLFQLMPGYLLFRFLFAKESFIMNQPGSKVLLVLIHIPLLLLLVLGIRGGWQQIPINESSAYFSRYQVVNDAAVNTAWNAGKKFAKGDQSLYKNPYSYLPAEEATRIVRSLYHPAKDSTIHVLTTDRPNIVLFILESFTADVIDALEGEKNVTPHMNALISEGILFTNIYSSGFRTDQGLAAILSGFPAQPNFSIIMQPEKFLKLPFLTGELKQAGYHLSFFYGGETAFANMKAYLLRGGMEHIIDKSSFSSDEMNAKWGAHDGFVFQKQAAATNKESLPFFSVILSLSSHEPFEVPMKTRFAGTDDPSKFKNSCAYTDQSIGAYFESVKKEAWYPNTLFILVADHGHLLPRNRDPKEPARFHIPVIFFGDVIRPEFRGARFSNKGMQNDLPATLLAQLNLPSTAFEWSNNLLNPFRNNFAYYTSDDAFGWITDAGSVLLDFKKGTNDQKSIPAQQSETGRAYLQILFDEYINY